MKRISWKEELKGTEHSDTEGRKLSSIESERTTNCKCFFIHKWSYHLEQELLVYYKINLFSRI